MTVDVLFSFMGRVEFSFNYLKSKHTLQAARICVIGFKAYYDTQQIQLIGVFKVQRREHRLHFSQCSENVFCEFRDAQNINMEHILGFSSV